MGGIDQDQDQDHDLQAQLVVPCHSRVRMRTSLGQGEASDVLDIVHDVDLGKDKYVGGRSGQLTAVQALHGHTSRDLARQAVASVVHPLRRSRP